MTRILLNLLPLPLSPPLPLLPPPLTKRAKNGKKEGIYFWKKLLVSDQVCCCCWWWWWWWWWCWKWSSYLFSSFFPPFPLSPSLFPLFSLSFPSLFPLFSLSFPLSFSTLSPSLFPLFSLSFPSLFPLFSPLFLSFLLPLLSFLTELSKQEKKNEPLYMVGRSKRTEEIITCLKYLNGEVYIYINIIIIIIIIIII